MHASELRDLSPTELEDKERELRAEFFNLRFQHATNQLDNPMRLRSVRRDIARVRTVLSQRRRELQASTSQPAAEVQDG